MNKYNIQLSVLISILIFSLLYTTAAVLLVSFISPFLMQVAISAVLFIVYINVLKLFLFELYGVQNTRATEMLMYAVLYLVTFSVLIAHFFIDSVELFSYKYVRYIMIAFASIMLFKYFIYMIIGPIYDVLQRIKYEYYFKDKEYNPKISVIIPAWNEEVGILNTIESVLKSTYRNFEIVVINDGSTDNSDVLIRNYINKLQQLNKNTIPIIYKYQENAGKGSALNHGIEISSGDIICTIDADCVVDKHALQAVVNTFKDESVMAGVGNVVIANHSSSIGVVQYLEYLFSFYFKRTDAFFGSIYIIGGAAGVFRKEVFDKIGGYSTKNMTEDIELSVRIQDAGMKIEYLPDMIVYTEGASDLAGLKGQRLRWKKGRFQTFIQHRHMFFSLKKHHNKMLTCFIMPLALLQEVQLLFELPFLFLLYIYSLFNTEFSSLLFAMIVVSSMFVIQFVFYQKNEKRISFLLLAPIGWLLFYIATYVEFTALLKTIYTFLKKKDVSWQKWERKGIAHIN